MERYLLNKFIPLIEEEEGVTNVELFHNLIHESVVSFMFGGHKFVVTIEDLGGVSDEAN